MACEVPTCPDLPKCDDPGVCLAREPGDRLAWLLGGAHTSESEPPCLGWAPLRAAARAAGYTLAVHGSLRRDFDLVAIPWREGAVGPAYALAFLLGQLAEQLGRSVRLVDFEPKPLGRLAATLQPDAWAKPIDLSIAPGGSGWDAALGACPLLPNAGAVRHPRLAG